MCQRGVCNNFQGSFQCICDPGYVLTADRSSCIDLDECIRSPNICNNGTCINSMGSYQCQCYRGFKIGPNRDCIGKTTRVMYPVIPLDLITLIFRCGPSHWVVSSVVLHYLRWPCTCLLLQMESLLGSHNRRAFLLFIHFILAHSSPLSLPPSLPFSSIVAFHPSSDRANTYAHLLYSYTPSLLYHSLSSSPVNQTNFRVL